MPTFVFKCDKCKVVFEDLCTFNQIDSIRCSGCGGEVNHLPTIPLSVIFKEKKGTSREDNFEYVAKWNAEQNANLRRAAESAQGKSPYKDIDDSAYEGKIV